MTSHLRCPYYKQNYVAQVFIKIKNIQPTLPSRVSNTKTCRTGAGRNTRIHVALKRVNFQIQPT